MYFNNYKETAFSRSRLTKINKGRGGEQHGERETKEKRKECSMMSYDDRMEKVGAHTNSEWWNARKPRRREGWEEEDAK